MERRYERLRPAEMRELVGDAPIAWVPIGTLEFHGEHLPFGVDAFEAHELCLRCADRSGGIVLPATYLASGVLSLEYSLTFDLSLVCRTVEATIAELALAGFRVVVVLIGHGPLDLNHGLKSMCAKMESHFPNLTAYALVWYELNAAQLDTEQVGEPTVVSHAGFVETSYMMALAPELVALDRLPDDPNADILGVYGRNPKNTASREWGAQTVEANVDLLSRRASLLLNGGSFDRYEDLRRFVDYCWPEVLDIAGRSGSIDAAALLLTNLGEYSRFITSLTIEIDGDRIPDADIQLINENIGEGTAIDVAALSPENGFYIRRCQTTTALLNRTVAPGVHRVEMKLGLGGVRDSEISTIVEFANPL